MFDDTLGNYTGSEYKIETFSNSKDTRRNSKNRTS